MHTETILFSVYDHEYLQYLNTEIMSSMVLQYQKDIHSNAINMFI